MSGWLFGAILSAVEEMGGHPPTTRNVPMARAHRRGGAIAALLLFLASAPNVSPIGIGQVTPFIPIALVAAAIPHLVLTWRALRQSNPPVTAASTDAFAIRLASLLFALAAITSVEAALLGPGR
jgi:hypothetical protein